MALLLGVADAQDRVTSLDVVCPNQKATLQMTADNATYYCGTDSSKSQIHWVQMAVDFQVNVQAKSMELNVSDGEILGTLCVELPAAGATTKRETDGLCLSGTLRARAGRLH
jgi:hypothetical protein